jgi:asparagine synthase (glutamine-hydrolysing)
MCGIAGIANLGSSAPPSIERLQAMCRTIVHRGPDDEGLDIRDGVALGMRRLSIIDLSGGRQPIFNETGTIRAVFNGEIYNFQELRVELESLGHVFTTRSDTEVIVHAYEQFGQTFARRLNGMFAFALHDIAQRTLLLVRDQVGIKPLYFHFDGHILVWGSEIKAVLASGQVPRDLDMNGLGDFLAWEYVPGQGTLFKGIEKLRPGEMLIIDCDKAALRRNFYWDVPDESEDQSLKSSDWEEMVASALERSVRRQMVSDVPLGAFLSGGVDSSLLVSFMGNAQTFSIGFDDPSYSELAWSSKVAHHLGVSHRTEIIRPDVAELFTKLLYFLDDPIGDFSIFPTFLVSRLAREHVTVSLSGDGGDELFGGYESYLADSLAKKFQLIPSWFRTTLLKPAVNGLKPREAKKGLINKAKRFIEGMNYPECWGHARWRVFAGESLRREVLSTEALKEVDRPVGAHIEELFGRAIKRQPLNRSLYVDFKSYLPDNILCKVDRMSMAVSLEARVPYLDTELVELAFRIPEHFKLEGRQTKAILKKVASSRIPRECIYRPKEGFSIPIKNWLKKELRPVMEDLLAPSVLRNEGCFQVDKVERLKNEHLSSKANHSHILWSLMVFQGWKRLWLNKDVRAAF